MLPLLDHTDKYNAKSAVDEHDEEVHDEGEGEVRSEGGAHAFQRF